MAGVPAVSCRWTLPIPVFESKIDSHPGGSMVQRYREGRRFAGIITYRRLDDPFSEGMPLHGFTLAPPAIAASRRLRALQSALSLTHQQLSAFRLGVLPDGRWAL